MSMFKQTMVDSDPGMIFCNKNKSPENYTEWEKKASPKKLHSV